MGPFTATSGLTMFKKFALLAAALALPALWAGAARAAQQITTGTFEFAAAPGYGFKYSATWDSSVAFELRANGNAQFFPNGWSSVGGYITLVPTAPVSASFSNLTSLSVQAQLSISFVNLTTGAFELPPAVYVPFVPTWKPDINYHIGRGGPCTSPGGDVELRFSNSKCSFSTTLTKDNALPDGRFAASAKATANLQVQAGQYLKVSDDPACASLSCMTTGHDVINRDGITLLANVSMVPEPSTWGLLLAGVSVLGLLRHALRAKT